jgi:hypothetical protein
MSHQSDTGVSRTSLYEGSTQYRHWRFSPEQLAETRKTLNTAAVAAIRNAFEADSAGYLPLLFIRSQLSSSLARVVLTGFLSDCKRGELTSKALYRQGLPIMWPLSFSRGGRGNGHDISEEILSQEHRHGLAPEERHVCNPLTQTVKSD